MRINLNFKDSTITQISQSEFRIVFDLSKMIKPRLSSDARMYIEHFNLPQFIDDKWGKINGDLEGYFELRCDNISNNDFDSEFGNTGNSIIYTSPMNNFATFTNNDPMFISNFKISQNFLKDTLVFVLKIFDKNGDPYTTSTSSIEEVDTTTVEYATYNGKLVQMDNFKTNLENAENILNVIDARIETEKLRLEERNTIYTEKQRLLFEAIDKVLAHQKLTKCKIFKIQGLRNELVSESLENYTYLFETFLKNIKGDEPYIRIKTQLEEFYNAYIEKKNYVNKIDQSNINKFNIDSTYTNIFYENTSVFDPSNISLEPNIKKNLNYEVVSGGGIANKTGTIDVTYFNSIETNTHSVIVDNILPDAGTNNILAINDILVIDNSNFKAGIKEKHEYRFCKTDSDQASNIEFQKSDGTPFGATEARKVKFSMKVLRDGTNYTYEFTDDIHRTGMFDNAKMIIKGSNLDGTDGTNDLTLQINSVIVPQTSVTYNIVDYLDDTHTDNGTISFDITRDNTNDPATYTLKNKDFSKTKNFNTGEFIKVSGTRFDGEDGNHDVTLTINDVVANRKFNINQDSSIHAIPNIEINDTNSKVFDILGDEKTDRTGYKIIITSENGDYIITFDPTADASTNFEVGDTIKILGNVLTGEDTTNNLELKILTVTTAKKIDTIQIDPAKTFISRYPSPFTLDVEIPIDATDYIVENFRGDDNAFFENDIIIVLGSKLGGTDVTNDLAINIGLMAAGTPTTVAMVAGAVPIMRIIDTYTNFGTPNSDTGTEGQIKAVTLSGIGEHYPAEGSWEIADTNLVSGTPIDTANLQSADLKITLNKMLQDGVNKIKNDIISKNTEIIAAKAALPTKKKTYFLDLNNQATKLKCMNISLVLYDEIDEYKQSSTDAIKGNTYSRLNTCQFKRI